MLFEIPNHEELNAQIIERHKLVQDTSTVSYHSVRTKDFSIWKDWNDVPAINILGRHFVTNAEEYGKIAYKADNNSVFVISRGWINTFYKDKTYSSDSRGVGKDGYLGFHNHYNKEVKQVSGVYYVDAEEDEEHGILEFIDPQIIDPREFMLGGTPSWKMEQHKFKIKPKNGTMILFSDVCFHAFTKTSRTVDNPRLSISTNIQAFM